MFEVSSLPSFARWVGILAIHVANACRCVFSVRCDVGNLKSLNELAKQARADHIIHTGDFGFYDDTSLDRIADK